MTVFAQKDFYDVEEYLAIQERSLEKLEYYDGKIKPMSGGTFTHAELCANAIFALKLALKNASKKYRLCTSDIKIQIEKHNQFLYPDAVVVDEKPVLYAGRNDIITNPTLIVEVLSKSTKKKDLTDKFESYKTLPSFEEYVVISQEKIEVKTFYKANDWQVSLHQNIKDTFPLMALGLNISMEDIYGDTDLIKPST
ncbi:MAG: Uma2 family endonuclease [Bacteroidota bacterium]